MNTVIKVENLSKQYRLGQVGTGTISHDVNRWWHNIRGKENPYLKIGESNDRTVKGESDYVWALKDINFEVKQGEVLGIIGRNGAGKSTLLKILSRTTAPTTGSAKIKGRVASLLEVGTGFHPELSGRDNIFLNGAILGMTRREILSNFDEMVNFAGVERYIDTPVKRYSSGMYVRLAFAVAAFLDSDILIVDEVLAVGDLEFQEKCLNKIDQISSSNGRTILFVSHNLEALKRITSRSLLMANGTVVSTGNTGEIIESYSSKQLTNRSGVIRFNNLHKKIQVSSALINGLNYDLIKIEPPKNLLISLIGEIEDDFFLNLEVRIYSENKMPLGFYSDGHLLGKTKKYLKGRFEITREIFLPAMMNKGMFWISIELTDPGKETFFCLEKEVCLECAGYATMTGHIFTAKQTGWVLLKGN